jgi:predicted MFS family arabinose efflux permease
MDSTFNNYVNETFSISSLGRTLLEIPRETPGLLLIFVAAFLFFLSGKRLAALAMLLCSAGLILIAVIPHKYALMLGCLFVYSLGQHLFLPLSSTIGMELAREGAPGRRLGQLNSARNFATIIGSFGVLVAFHFLHCTFSIAFIIAAFFYVCAAAILMKMNPGQPHKAGIHLKLHKEYRLYYALCILFGTRKQIFITFAPWVLVTVFKQPTAFVATLLTIGGILGIVFQPFLGRAIDRFGERTILAGEAILLVVVCVGYSLAGKLFSQSVALIIVAVCYVFDQLLMSVSMARATYLKKIAKNPAHIGPTLTMGVSIDHIFSIGGAIVCGIIWYQFGYQYVFMVAAAIAAINFFTTLRIVIPQKSHEAVIAER